MTAVIAHIKAVNGGVSSVRFSPLLRSIVAAEMRHK